MLDPASALCFLTLPGELIEQVLVELHPSVCKKLWRLIDDSIEIQLRIELAIGGYLLGDRGNMPASELMQRARARRVAYETFHPKWFWKVERFGETDTHQFEVADGIWGYSKHEGDSSTFRGLHFEELASPHHEGGRWEITRDDIGMDATDFAYWLGMDALVLMEFRDKGETRRMHFRKLSANESHPLATVPHMDFFKKDCEVWEFCNTVSFEERVAMVFGDFEGGTRRTAVIVLDWRMGRVLMPYTTASDLAFLTKDLVLLSHSATEHEDAIFFDVFSLVVGKVLYRCNLPLPADAYVSTFLTHPASKHGGVSPTKHAKAFIPDPSVEIIGIIIRSTSEPSEIATVALSTHRFLQTLEDLAMLNSGEDDEENDPPVFEWNEWGPPVTRWFPSAVHGEVGVRTVFGARMVAVLVDRTEEGFNNVFTMLIDLNPRSIVRGAQNEDMGDYFIRVVEQMSIVTIGDITVESSLPYRAWISQRRSWYLGWFLDGNTIVGRLEDAYHFFSFLPPENSAVEEDSLTRVL